MDEEISIANIIQETKELNFFINNKKKLCLISAFLIILISFFIYSSVKKNKLALNHIT